MGRPRDDRQKDLLQPALDQIIDLKYPLGLLGDRIDRDFLDCRFRTVCSPGPGQPGLPTRLVAGLFILKHMHNLSDEVLCARWLENPYYQYFCGELWFCHQLPFDRSLLTRWRQRLGEEQLVALIQESLSVGHKTAPSRPGTWSGRRWIPPCSPRRLTRGSCTGRWRSWQAPWRGAAPELSAGRQAGGHHGRALQTCPSVQARPPRAQVPAHPPGARHPRHQPQDRWQCRPGRALPAAADPGRPGADPGSSPARPQGLFAPCPEVECIGKGKARAPYEFGCKVFVATPVTKPKGGQFVLHATALHGNPFDGHTLGPAIADIERMTGAEVKRRHVDKGYRGDNHPDKFRIWISGQVRRTTAAVKREMKRRAAVEPVIGHVKAEQRMDRNYLKGREGDRINAVLAAASYNFSLLIRWLAELLRVLILLMTGTRPIAPVA